MKSETIWCHGAKFYCILWISYRLFVEEWEKEREKVEKESHAVKLYGSSVQLIVCLLSVFLSLLRCIFVVVL